MDNAALYLADLDFQPAATPSSVEFISSHSCHAGKDVPTDLAYWASQVTSPVDYLSACRAVSSRTGRTFFMELGFASTLTNFMRSAASAASAPPPMFTGGVRPKSVPEYVAKVVAAAYQAGTRLDWREINQVTGG